MGSNSLPSGLQAALASLDSCRWSFRHSLGEPQSVARTLESYLIGLIDQIYHRELSESEEEYERAKWFRAQGVLSHLDMFHQLIEESHRFVVELTRAGGQQLLGTRAGLPRLKRAVRPSNWVKFGSVRPPETPPLWLPKYEKEVGGPHILGARLIWWCAAARAPEEFGYPADFPTTVRTQPIWTTHRDLHVQANPRPLVLMKRAAVEVCSLLGTKASPRVVEKTAAPVPNDGPVEPDLLCWKGKWVKLQRKPWLIVNFLWSQRPSTEAGTRKKKAQVTDVEDYVWGKDVPQNTWYSTVSRARAPIKKLGFSLIEDSGWLSLDFPS